MYNKIQLGRKRLTMAFNNYEYFVYLASRLPTYHFKRKFRYACAKKRNQA